MNNLDITSSFGVASVLRSVMFVFSFSFSCCSCFSPVVHSEATFFGRN